MLSRYDQWLTTQPDYGDAAPPLKCPACGRFVSRRNPLRTEPGSDGWQCDGKRMTVHFTYCKANYDDAARCWQDGWSKAEVKAHNAEYHKPMSETFTKCGESDAHEPHFVEETSWVTMFYACSAGHEASEVEW
jgi:hypothetical protein